jgi:mono/diheme cytochrome c family protein
VTVIVKRPRPARASKDVRPGDCIGRLIAEHDEKCPGDYFMRRLILAAFVLAVLGAASFWILTLPSKVSAAALPAYTPNLANGKIMFHAGGCSSCHTTPNEEDKTRLGGGMELKSPYGSFYPPNISPDPSDGIGTWSEADFVSAMWKGTAPDGRHYFPAFPYTSYQRMMLEDVRDLYAHLKTLPAVQGKARGHDLPFPYNIRRLIGGWKYLYLDSKPFTPDPAQSAQWNRGGYLVNGPGHCAECHSPRDRLGGIIERQRFAGGPSPDGEGWIPNITQAGIGDYSVGDIEEILTTGQTPDDSVGGTMVAVVRNTAQLSKEDRTAMAVYIKSLPPVTGPKPPASQ